MNIERIKTCLSYVFEYESLESRDDRIKNVTEAGIEVEEKNWLIKKNYITENYTLSDKGRQVLKNSSLKIE